MIIPNTIILAALTIGSITDIKTREIPDMLNFLLTAIGVSMAIAYSIYTQSLVPIGSSMAGILLAVIIGNIMYYTGQWGGGDAKMLIGIGAAMGVPLSLSGIPLLLVFVINSFLVGAAYGVTWILALSVVNRKEVIPLVSEALKKSWLKIVLLAAFSATLFITILLLSQTRNYNLYVILAFILILPVFYVLMIMMQAAEKKLMHVKRGTDKLTEGDWILDEKIMAGKKELQVDRTGITKQQIKMLRDAGVKEVTVKDGIPFVPSFLIAMIITLLIGDWISILLF